MHKQTNFPESMLLVGCGNMGGAMLRGWIAAGANPQTITVVDPYAADLPSGVKVRKDFSKDMPAPDFVLLAIKPQMLDAVAPILSEILNENTLVVSILAGVELSTLSTCLPRTGRLLRVMPNMAVSIGKSIMALVGNNLPDDQRVSAESIMACLGPVEWLTDEDQMHLVTALSGSGPAYVFRLIDALGIAAQRLGMEEGQAQRFALGMTEGAALLAAGSDETPGQLADRVASPGGTTRQGMNVLDADERLIELLEETLKAAADRSREMAVEALG